MSFEIMVMYALVGLIAGVLAGLLGVGGGIVIVPMLVFCFVRQGVQPEVMMHLALGTSLASIMFTSISSCLAHHRRGAVLWPIVRQITPGILIGTFVASRLSTGFLRVFFCVFLYVIATQMLLNKKPKPSRELPGTGGMFEVGGVIDLGGGQGALPGPLAGGPLRGHDGRVAAAASGAVVLGAGARGVGTVALVAHRTLLKSALGVLVAIIPVSTIASIQLSRGDRT